MNLKFQTVHGEIVNPSVHAMEQLRKDRYVEIHIGTDSQVVRRRVIYSTVIAFRFGEIDNHGRGVHYIYNKTRIPKKDLGCKPLTAADRAKGKRAKDDEGFHWNRLWKETELTMEIAEHLRSKMNIDIQIDMDFSNLPEHFSNKLVSASVGWAESLGYRVNIKPFNQIATKAADHHCKV